MTKSQFVGNRPMNGVLDKRGGRRLGVEFTLGTGTSVSIGAKYVPHFKPGMRLRQRVERRIEVSELEEMSVGGR